MIEFYMISTITLLERFSTSLDGRAEKMKYFSTKILVMLCHI